MERLGHDKALTRDLFLLEAGRVEDVPTLLKVPTARFVVLLVWDAADVPVEDVARLADTLLRAGCVYVCTWGDSCERVHDIVDEVHVAATLDAPDSTVVMTTWHAGESLDDALWFFLSLTHPYDAVAENCGSSVVICIDQDRDRVTRVRNALCNPAEFLEEVGKRDDSKGVA